MNVTAAQARFAASLQDDLRERITWTIDREQLAAALRPQVPLYGATEEEKAARRDFDADTAIAAWIARREELAATDLSTLDKDAMSAWIDAAKKAI